MRKCFLLTLTLITLCCGNPSAREGRTTDHTVSPTPNATSIATPENKPSDQEVKTEVPPEFRNVDFKNFTYPVAYNNSYISNVRRRRIELKNGTHEYPSKHGGGGSNYELEYIYYVDIDGDGVKEKGLGRSQILCG